MNDLRDWDPVAGNNNDAPPDGAPENMAPSAVNDCMREMMAVLARWKQDNDGTLTATGTANAQALTSSGTYSALQRGDSFVFRPVADNTGAVTLAIGGLSARPIKTQGGADLSAGALDSSGLASVVYDGTNFVLLNEVIIASDIDGLLSGVTTATPASADLVLFQDASASNALKKATFATLTTGLFQHNNLGPTPSEHVDHSGVSISAGTGLSGGGTIESSRSISLDTSSSRNVDHSAVSINTGTGLTGGGSIDSSRTISLDTSDNRNTAHSSISVVAGNGLTGGGTIASSRTINVGAGNGINVSADAVAMSGSYTGTFTATEVLATSDARLKSQIRDVSGAGAQLARISPRHYRFDLLDADQYGVLAQELQDVVPEAVSDDDDGYLAVNYNQLVALLIADNNAMRKRLEAIEAKIQWQ